MHSSWAFQLLSKKGGELHLDTPSAPPHFPISQVLMKGTSESQQKLGGGGGGGREESQPPSGLLPNGMEFLHCTMPDSNRCSTLSFISYLPPHTQGLPP